MNRSSAVVIVSVLVALLMPHTGRAQLAPSGAHHSTVGGGSGLNMGPSPTGGYGAAVPLDLPAPRGNLPLPLSVVHTGSSRAGAAGVGWDIPLSYVRVSTSMARRKPAMNGKPVPERVFLSLQGSPMLMVDANVTGLYTPHAASTYWRLERSGDDWIARDPAGREYVFVPASNLTGVTDPGLWLLKRVRERVGTDWVKLSYRSNHGGCHEGAPEILLDAIEYTYGSSDAMALYRIELDYRRWMPPSLDLGSDPGLETCSEGAETGLLLATGTDEGHFQSRSHIVDSIDILARDNTLFSPAASTPEVIRSYQFAYGEDVHTAWPRLEEVEVRARGDASQSLPVMELDYGQLMDLDHHGPELRYEAGASLVPRVSGLPDPDALSSSMVTREEVPHDQDEPEEDDPNVPDDGPPHPLTRIKETVVTRQMLRDVTGDGRPDLIYAKGTDTWVVPNVPEGDWAALDDAAQGFSLGQDVPLPTEISFRPKDLLKWNSANRRTVKHTWVSWMDWNGDGRLDIVDARGGQDSDHWRVLINAPVAGEPYAFELHEYQADVGHLKDWLVARYPDVESYQPLPLSRSKSAAAQSVPQCVRWEQQGQPDTLGNHWWDHDDWGDPQPCEEPDLWDPLGMKTRRETYVEWKVHDMNGDGYPDFVANDRPVAPPDFETSHSWEYQRKCPFPDSLFSPLLQHLHNEYPWYLDSDEPLYDYATNTFSIEATCYWLMGLEIPADNIVQVFVNDGGVSWQALGGRTFRWEPLAWKDGTCGVEKWQTVSWENASSENERVCSVQDVTGDGIADAAGVGNGEGAHGPFGYTDAARFESNRNVVCSPDYDGPDVPVETRQVYGLVDLTGDGLLDEVRFLGGYRGWTIRPGTGAGLGPEASIEADDFELSLSQADSCDDEMKLVRGIMDLDADGLPELVGVSTGGVMSARAIRGVTDTRGRDAGRLIAVGNGYGATTHIDYTSAKTDTSSLHRVPFPEIVVEQTWVTVAGGQSLAPTLFAYGDAELRYDPLMLTWSFPGYRRRVTMRGEPAAGDDVGDAPGRVRGAVLIQDARPPGDPVGFYEDMALTGVVTDVHRLEGTFDADPWQLLDVDMASSPYRRAGARTEHAVAELPDSGEGVGLYLDGCFGVDPYSPPDLSSISGDLDLCMRTGVVYPETSSSWEGEAAPPSLSNTETEVRITSVDEFGRPTTIYRDGDTRRLDDDTCVVIDYADPQTTDGTGMEVVHATHVTDCGIGNHGVPRTLAGVRYAYDGLGESAASGAFSVGYPTKRIVERYDAQTGEPLGELVAAEYGYNDFGRVEIVHSSRDIGQSAERETKVLYDTFGLTVTDQKEWASDVPKQFSRHVHSSVMPWASDRVTAPNGVTYVTDYDDFGRPIRSAVETSEGSFLLSQTTYETFEGSGDEVDRAVTVRSFREWTPYTEDPSGLPAQGSTTFIDPLGRARHTVHDLGADYGDWKVITGFRRYDDLGRVTYEADPFPEQVEKQFDPDSVAPLPYGTSYAYDVGGRVHQATRGYGQIGDVNFSDPAEELFPTEYSYDWANGQAIVRRRGPNEKLSGGDQYGAYDETRSSAIGRVLNQSRHHGGSRIELTEYGYNRLGARTVTRRFGDPETRGKPVTWSTAFDSLGRQLTVSEPGTSTQHFAYDEWGGLVDSWHVDGGVQRHQTQAYDGFGRVIRRKHYDQQGNTEEVDWLARYFYDVASGSVHQKGADNLLGRLSHAQVDGFRTVYFDYDELGRTERTIWRPTGADLPRDQVDARYEVVRDHAADGALTQLEFHLPGDVHEIVDYTHDSAGRVRKVRYDADLRDGQGPETLFEAYGLDALGHYSTTRLGNDVYEQFQYDDQGRRNLLGKVVTGPQEIHERELVEYGGEGRLLKEKSRQFELQGPAPAMATTTHAYDALDRLKKTSRSGGNAQPFKTVWEYDPLGNVTQKKDYQGTFGHLNIIHEPDDPDRIDEVFGCGGSATDRCRYSYDGLGNVTEIERYVPGQLGDWVKGNTTFEYDAGGRAVGMDASGKSANLEYGPFGELAEISVKGASVMARHERRYGALVAEGFFPAEPDHQQLERRIPGPLGVVATVRGTGDDATILYHHGDGTANRLFTDEKGEFAQRMDYDPYGQVMSDTGTPGAADYSYEQWNFGDAFHEFGVVRLGARLYHPETGRFLQRDPLMLSAGASGSNPYAFAFNDPVNFSDPSGFAPGYVDELLLEDLNPFAKAGLQLGAIGLNLVVQSAKARDQFSRRIANRVMNRLERNQRRSGGITSRAWGVLKVGAGWMGMKAGASLCATGLGCAIGGPLFVASADYAGAGVTQVVSGSPQKTVAGTFWGERVQQIQAAIVEGAALARAVVRPSGTTSSATAGSFLQQASKAANRAAGRIGKWTPKNKHLLSGGSQSKAKFLTDNVGEVRSLVQQALRSPNAHFLPNPNIPNTFRVVTDMAQTVGVKGQKFIRAVVGMDGRVINAFPVHRIWP